MTLKLRPVVVIVAVLGICVVLALIFLQNDPQGEENSDCMQVNKFSIQSDAGMSASEHTTICTTLSTTIVTYVYVHPSGQLPTAKYLVFRYSQLATADAPKIRWIDGQHVLVEPMHVETISKMKKRLASVSIDYKIADGSERTNP